MEREFCKDTRKNIERVNDVSKKKLIQLREKVNELHFTFSLSKNEIIRQTGFSRGFVMKWTKSSEQDFSEDNRGWPKGKGRKWDDEDRNRIINVYRKLKNDSQDVYSFGETLFAMVHIVGISVTFE